MAWLANCINRIANLPGNTKRKNLYLFMPNMLAIVISVNILLIAALMLVSFGIGYFIRSQFIKSCRKRIFELEREMLRDNARILELEREKVELMKNSVANRQQ